MAVGDALGAGYEFGGPIPPDQPVRMAGGGLGNWAPGEWTDDTSMAVVIAQAAAERGELTSLEALDRIAAGWYRWSRHAPDVGVQTRAVLTAAARGGSAPTADDLIAASRQYTARHPRSAGNGSLMRTAPVALAYLDDPDGLVHAAATISDMTHSDPKAVQGCMLWSLAIRHAVLTGELDVRIGLPALHDEARDYWAARIEEAEGGAPARFSSNGWVVQALQAAWSAIISTPQPPERPREGSFRAGRLAAAIEAAVRGGHDTDTVAAIAGGLLGAAYGASAVPGRWRRILHGWPGLRARDLARLGLQIAQGGVDAKHWPGVAHMSYDRHGDVSRLAVHPHDRGVLIGGVGRLSPLPEGVTAVVSLCRLGSDDVPASGVAATDHVEVWLVDQDDPAANPHLAYVLDDAAGSVAALRSEGHTVLLHCVEACSRSPAVGALHGARTAGLAIEQAIDDIGAVLPHMDMKPALRAALYGLTDS